MGRLRDARPRYIAGQPFGKKALEAMPEPRITGGVRAQDIKVLQRDFMPRHNRSNLGNRPLGGHLNATCNAGRPVNGHLFTAALPKEHAVILRPACGPKNLAVTPRERRDSSLRSE